MNGLTAEQVEHLLRTIDAIVEGCPTGTDPGSWSDGYRAGVIGMALVVGRKIDDLRGEHVATRTA